jgi:hypothetical protein
LSSLFTGLLRGRFDALAPLFGRIGRGAGRTAVRFRLATIAEGLIGFADAVEAGVRFLARGARALSRRQGVGLTGGLAWRGLAAITGIGLATALVTALSAANEERSIATLTLATAPESRPIRDVALEPRLQRLAGEDWVRIARPIAMFGLESPELDRQTPAYESRRTQDGARREDTLVYGVFAEPRAHLLLRLSLDRNPDRLSQPFVIATVREAAGRGMSIQRSGAAAPLDSRFGRIETADVTLSDGETSRACIAFRREAGDLPFGLSGWWCGGPSRPADRQQLSCLLDRLDLLSAADDRALRTAFARTELARQPGCVPPRLSASGRKASWLDADGHAPLLKTAARR